MLCVVSRIFDALNLFLYVWLWSVSSPAFSYSQVAPYVISCVSSQMVVNLYAIYSFFAGILTMVAYLSGIRSSFYVSLLKSVFRSYCGSLLCVSFRSPDNHKNRHRCGYTPSADWLSRTFLRNTLPISKRRVYSVSIAKREWSSLPLEFLGNRLLCDD